MLELIHDEPPTRPLYLYGMEVILHQQKNGESFLRFGAFANARTGERIRSRAL
jgi:hypothetical protein